MSSQTLLQKEIPKQQSQWRRQKVLDPSMNQSFTKSRYCVLHGRRRPRIWIPIPTLAVSHRQWQVRVWLESFANPNRYLVAVVRQNAQFLKFVSLSLLHDEDVDSSSTDDPIKRQKIYFCQVLKHTGQGLLRRLKGIECLDVSRRADFSHFKNVDIKAIQDCVVFVLLVSPAFCYDDMCHKEFNVAVKCGKPILPISYTKGRMVSTRKQLLAGGKTWHLNRELCYHTKDN